VINDCRNESLNLYNQFGIAMKNVFDIQVSLSVVLLLKKIINKFKVELCIVVAYKILTIVYLCQLNTPSLICSTPAQYFYGSDTSIQPTQNK